MRRAVIARLLSLLPHLRLGALAEMTVFKHSGGLDLIIDGLRKAGLPE